MEKQLKAAIKLLKSIVADVDAMRVDAPFDIRNDMPEEADHWFGGFEQTGLDDGGDDPVFQWPNLSLLTRKAEKLIEEAELRE